MVTVASSLVNQRLLQNCANPATIMVDDLQLNWVDMFTYQGGIILTDSMNAGCSGVLSATGL